MCSQLMASNSGQQPDISVNIREGVHANMAWSESRRLAETNADNVKQVSGTTVIPMELRLRRTKAGSHYQKLKMEDTAGMGPEPQAFPVAFHVLVTGDQPILLFNAYKGNLKTASTSDRRIQTLLHSDRATASRSAGGEDGLSKRGTEMVMAFPLNRKTYDNKITCQKSKQISYRPTPGLG
eukprot:Gb_26873 [translate_table: standard]